MSGVGPQPHVESTWSFWRSNTSTTVLPGPPAGSRSAASCSVASPGLGASWRRVPVEDGSKTCSGEISSVPGENRAAVSYTATAPLFDPVQNRESTRAKVIMVTLAVLTGNLRCGWNSVSSPAASVNVLWSSDSGDSMMSADVKISQGAS